MDTAGVGTADDVQLRVGTRMVVVLIVMAVVGRGVQREHGAVDQRRHAEHRAARIEPLSPRVERHGRAGRAHGLPGADARRECARHRDQRRPNRSGDKHVAGAATARPEDGQPDLHRRPRPFSLLRFFCSSHLRRA
jgi:hypothetical protein